MQEVVKFVEPLAGRKRSRDEPLGRDRGGLEGRKQAKKESEPTLSLSDARQDVFALGASAFEGRQQKKWEHKALQAAGVKVKHVIKMPLPMLVRVRQKQQLRERKQREAERVSDVVHGVSGPKHVHGAKKASSEKLRERRRRERLAAGTASLDPDNFRKGVLRIRPQSK